MTKVSSKIRKLFDVWREYQINERSFVNSFLQEGMESIDFHQANIKGW